VHSHALVLHTSTRQTTELAKIVKLAHIDHQIQPAQNAQQHHVPREHTEHSAMRARYPIPYAQRVRGPQTALSHGRKDVILHAIQGTSTTAASVCSVPFVLQAHVPLHAAPQPTQYVQNAETLRYQGGLTGPMNVPCAGTVSTTAPS
jgi:hypothetical protein